MNITSSVYRFLFLAVLAGLPSLSSQAQTQLFNKYYYEIRNTTKVKPFFFATITEDSSRIVKEFFKMDSTIAMKRVDILDKKRNPSRPNGPILKEPKWSAGKRTRLTCHVTAHATPISIQTEWLRKRN
jgi:hypothetical protein